MYPIWLNSAKSATLRRIGQLCTVLEVMPGDWFTWAETPGGRQLVWNVKEEALRRGIPDARQFSYRAGLYYQSASAIWEGGRQVAVLEVLARIATALERCQSPGACINSSPAILHNRRQYCTTWPGVSTRRRLPNRRPFSSSLGAHLLPVTPLCIPSGYDQKACCDGR